MQSFRRLVNVFRKGTLRREIDEELPVAEALLTVSYVKTELLDGAASFKRVQTLRVMARPRAVTEILQICLAGTSSRSKRYKAPSTPTFDCL